MLTQFYTYLHCKPNGEPFYVGKGFGKRCNQFSTRSNHHKNIVAKYGRENISVFIFPCENEQQAFSDEVQQIAQLRSDGYKLANITNGGEGVSGLTKPVSPEQRVKLSIAMMGNKRWLGKKHSEETKIKMSISQRELFNGVLAGAIEKLRVLNQKKVLCTTTGEIFDSASEAAKKFNIKDKLRIQKCCRGVCNHVRRYKFQYI